MAERDDSLKWHLDKRVPLALILALVAQTGAVFWWAAKTDARVEALERRASTSDMQIERVIRLEERLVTVQQGIAEIKQLIRQGDPR